LIFELKYDVPDDRLCETRPISVLTLSVVYEALLIDADWSDAERRVMGH